MFMYALVDDDSSGITLFGVTEERHSVSLEIPQFYYYCYLSLPAEVARKDPTDPSLEYLADQLRDLINQNLTRIAREKNKRGGVPQVIGVSFERRHNLYGYSGEDPPLQAKIVLDRRTGLYDVEHTFLGKQYTLQVQPGKRVPWEPMVFETGIDKNARFMIDAEITGMGWVRVTAPTPVPPSDAVHTTQIQVTAPFQRVHGFQKDELADLDTMYFDCEMAGRKGIFPDPLEDPVIQIACVSRLLREKESYHRRLFVLGQCEPIQGATVVSFNNEADLLDAFAEYVRKSDPDVISGYNINNFDLPYLIRRAEKVGACDLAYLGRTRGIPCKLKTRTFESKAYGASEMTDLTRCDGRIIMDCIEWVRRDYKLRSYTLNAVCGEFLQGMTKEDMPHDQITPLHKSGPAGRRRIGIYCIKDAWLPMCITDDQNKVFTLAETARVCRVPPEYLFTRGQGVKVMAQLLHYTKRDGFLIPTLPRTAPGVPSRDTEEELAEEMAVARGNIPDPDAPEDEGLEESDGEDAEDDEENPPGTVEEAPKVRTVDLAKDLKWTAEAMKKKTAKKRKKDEGVAEDTEGKPGKKAYKGATVLEPIRGFYRKPIVCNDFASLYPSIMIAYNLCYTTWLNRAHHGLDPTKIITTPIKERFVDPTVRKGILPIILEDLLGARKRAKKDMAAEEAKNGKESPLYKVFDGRQLALKVSANSVYGFTGAVVGKLPCLAIGASVTSYGREMIEKSKEFVEKTYAGARVLYGDTDSIMIDFGVETMQEAARLGIESAKRITAMFNRHPIKLECEKGMCPYLLLEPKRYVYREWDVEHPEEPMKYKKGPKEGKYVVKAKGVGSERRDNTLHEVATQKKIQEALMDDDPDRAVQIAKDAIAAIVRNEVDMADMVMSAQWSKKVEDYKNVPTVVKLAQRMQKRDNGSAPVMGDRIPYVLVDMGLKKTEEKVCDIAEDPEYALRNDLPLHTRKYVERLENPITQLLELVVPNPASLREIFVGEHARCIVKQQSHTKGIAAACDFSIPCVGTVHVTLEDAGGDSYEDTRPCKAHVGPGRALCRECEGAMEETLEVQQETVTRALHDARKVWEFCAYTCKAQPRPADGTQEVSLQDLEDLTPCANKHCVDKNYYRRIALKRKAEYEERVLETLRTQEPWPAEEAVEHQYRPWQPPKRHKKTAARPAQGPVLWLPPAQRRALAKKQAKAPPETMQEAQQESGQKRPALWLPAKERAKLRKVGKS
jgi:DNA polymerase elongation subunit (family B)